MDMLITYRTVNEYPPQNVFVDEKLAGHVEFEGDGWGAFGPDGERLGFGTHKSHAGNILVEHFTKHERLDAANG